MTIDRLFYIVYYASKLILFVKDPSELYRFAVEISNTLVKLNTQSTLKKASFNKELVQMCQKLISLTNDDFKNYKYLLAQNIEIFLK